MAIFRYGFAKYKDLTPPDTTVEYHLLFITGGNRIAINKYNTKKEISLKMDSHIMQVTCLPEAMNKLVLVLALFNVFLLLPFSIFNLIYGPVIMGVGGMVVVSILVFSAWSILKYDHYRPALILYGLFPVSILLLVISIHTQGIIGVLWSYPTILLFYFTLPERKAWIANVALLVITAPFIWITFENVLAARIEATLVAVSIFSAIFINVINRQQKKLQLQAVTDPLTGILNRTLLSDTLIQAIQQNNRAKIPMTIASIDLDHFKKINDNRGHDAGDQVLLEVAKLLKNCCRQVDKVFRLGGEEFLVFFYSTKIEDGKHLAEKIRARIESLQTFPGHTITVSIGVADLQAGEDWQRWVKRADTNLYRAKENGRNRVVGT